MFSLVQFQEDHMRRFGAAQLVRNVYGNRRKAIGAARRNSVEVLVARGWSEADAKAVVRDAEAMYWLELQAA